MSKKTKLMSALLAFAFVVSLFTPKAFAYKVSDDVANTKYHEAATVLGALNIMVGDDTGHFRPEDGVTRAEFSKIAIHILGIEDASSQAHGISKFPDVDKSHWANGYINIASSQKIIVGDDTGLFRPDDKISYQEAITILVRVLGYEHLALSKGGYPTGYIIVGSDTGLTKKTQSTGAEICARGTTAQMTFNALTINLMEPVGFSTDNNVTYRVTDKTLLKDKLNVTKGTGVVTGNELTRLESGLALKENQIEFDGEKVYKTENNEGEDLLGYSSVYYVKETENGDKKVILAYKDNGKTKETTILADKLSQEIKEDSTSIFYENENHKEEEFILEDDKAVIYNDKYKEKLINPKTGYITLLDNDGNDKYDVVFINEYENYVTDSISLTGQKIYDKNGKAFLDLNKENNRDLVVSITDKEGKEVELKDIKEWDILSVFKNEDYVKILVSRDVVTGKITELSQEDKVVVIEGKEYSPANSIDFKDLTLDLEGTFYLDINGDIAAFNAQGRQNINYAYMINAGLESGLDTSLSIKAFTSDGKTEVFKAADKIKIDDKTNYDPANAYKELLIDGKIVPAIFTYETNKNGEIIVIDRAENKTSAFPESFEDAFTLNYVGKDMTFNKENSSFVKNESNITKANVGVDKDTIIFAVEENEKDTEKMEMMTLEMLSDGGKYDIEVFDMSEDMTAKVIRVTNQVSVGKLSSPLAVVEKITSVYNQKGEKTDKIYVYYNGERKEFMSADDSVLVKNGSKKLEVGDIITFTLNADEEMDSVSLIFDVNSKDKEFAKEYGNSGEMVVVYGKVTGKFANSINLSVDGKSAVNYKIDKPLVYKINKNKITVSDFSEVSKWEDDSNEERVLVRIYENKVTEIVIVK